MPAHTEPRRSVSMAPTGLPCGFRSRHVRRDTMKTRPSADPARIQIAILALLSIAPFLVNLGRFRRLYWFGDDWLLLDEIEKFGAIRWLSMQFFENFVPLFKAVWFGAVLAFDGSYLAMIALLWLTHAVNVYLFGGLLLRAGLSVGATRIAVVTTGLAWSNIETLAWSVQWSSLLAMLFFLAALTLALEIGAQPGPPRLAVVLAYLACLAASPLCHGRGVASGLALAAFWAWPESASGGSRRLRGMMALLSLVPSALVGAVMFVFGLGGKAWIGTLSPATARRMAEFGLHYWSLSPIYHLAELASAGPVVVGVLGLIKVAILGGALSRSKGRTRGCLVCLLVADLGTAVLLGLGRYWTGVIFAASSRYQYASLISFSPFLGVLVSGPARLRLRAGRLRDWIGMGLLLVWACWIAWRWVPEMKVWSRARGTDVKTLLQSRRDGAPHIPGIPGISLDQGRTLMVRFNLH